MQLKLISKGSIFVVLKLLAWKVLEVKAPQPNSKGLRVPASDSSTKASLSSTHPRRLSTPRSSSSQHLMATSAALNWCLFAPSITLGTYWFRATQSAAPSSQLNPLRSSSRAMRVADANRAEIYISLIWKLHAIRQRSSNSFKSLFM